ncbi:MAG: hypothetical protein RL398_937 [Planctomycetota bacterium]
MPHVMARSLAKHGAKLRIFVPRRNQVSSLARLRTRVAGAIPAAAKQVLKQFLPVGSALPHVAWGGDDYASTMSHFGELANELRDPVARSKADFVFGCCTSSLLAGLQTELPITYFSDTTARLILTAYPELAANPEGWRRACEELEQEALRKAMTAAFATEAAKRSAIDHYGMAEPDTHTIPMGANVVPPARPVQEPCTPKRIRLVTIAADPLRKRLDFATAVVDALRTRGCDASLVAIGGTTPHASLHPHTRHLGRLRLSKASERQRLAEALAASHFLILPSLAEAFGIAPCEAAHAARPSIVSAAGGLPEVVRHGETGLVMPMAATPDDYAEALLRVAEQHGEYDAMCERALARARAEYTWDRWAERMMSVFERTLVSA